MGHGNGFDQMNASANKISTSLTGLLNRPRAKLMLGGALVVALVAVALLFNSFRPLTVKVATNHSNVPVRVFGLGTVEARVLAKVGFEIGATVVELTVDHGDFVKKGDVLARLHSAEQKAKLARAEVAVTSAKVGLIKAEANVKRTQAVLAQKQEVNRRKQALVGRRVVSEQTAEEAIRDEAVAKADLAVAESEVQVAEARVKDARAALQYEKILLDHHTLYAPFDAKVVQRLTEPGTVIKAGEPVFALVAPETVWALTYVDESRAGFIRVGQPAEVRLRSLPQELFKARVARIDIESDRVSEERRVYVKCEQCPTSFHLGEQAEVFITVAKLDKAVLVPDAAVRGFDGSKAKAWTVEDGRLRQREITFRHRTENSMLEVASDLPDSVRIVSVIQSNFREGRSARIAETGAAAQASTGAGQ